jgi:HEAT repeat protein
MSARDDIVAQIRRNVAPARAGLESVLLSLREFPLGVDRAPIAARIEAALDALMRMSGMDPEHATFFPTLDDAKKELAATLGLLEPLGGSTPVVRARSRVGATEKRLARLREASIDALVLLEDRRLRADPMDPALAMAEPFRASLGVPAAHAVLRASPRVLVELYPAAEHELLDDSEDVPDEPPRPPPPAPLTPEEVLLVDHARSMMRDCLHEIATLSGLRAPLDEAPWTHGEPFERRLLASLDAMHALAYEPHGLPPAVSLFEEVQRYAREAPTVDPTREFSRTLAFACARGDSALRGVVLALKQSHPMTLPAQEVALCLARHTATAELMRELLGEQDPLLLLLAIEVLRFCRDAGVPDLAQLTGHPHVQVRAAALSALGFVPERETAAEILVDALIDERDEHPRVALAAAEALVRLGRIDGLEWARERLASGPPVDAGVRVGCMRLLAVAGTEADAPLLTEAFGVAPREAELLGLHGHPSLVAPLLEALWAANGVRRSIGPWVHPLEVAAASALARITGLAPMDAPREVHDYDFTTHPSIFAETWQRALDERAKELPTSGKLRFGKPYRPELTIDELASDSVVAVRSDLAFELGLCLGSTPFEPTDWVARQRETLTSCRQDAARISYAAGSFPGASLSRGALPSFSSASASAR